MIRSRRGDTFLLLLDLIFLVALIAIFYKIASAFHLEHPDEPFGSRQAAMLRTYQAADAALVHLDVAARRATITATQHVAKSAGVLQEDTRCGTYAGLRRWTSPDAECFAQDTLTTALTQELQSRLRIMPGWVIPSIPYDIHVTPVNGALRITGVATKDVTLPILLVRGQDDRLAMELLTNGHVSHTTQAIVPDAHLPITVRATPGGEPRVAGTISQIVIHATATEDAAGALALYDRGATGAHYLIDGDGRITQLVREDLRVTHMNACATARACTIPNLEDTSIAIAIVAANPQAPLNGRCPDGMVGPREPVVWCGMAEYPTPAAGCPTANTASCWSPVSDAQREALATLVVDIARRRAIKLSATTVLLDEQIVFSDRVFGPGIAPAGEDAVTWWRSTLASTAAKATLPSDTTTPIVQSGDLPALSLPIDGQLYVSSCFGWRTLEGGPDKHDGIDFGGGGLEVRAAADGIVYSVCDDGDCIGLPRFAKDFGNNIIIAHGNGLFTRYNHLSDVRVMRGDPVARHQIIGVSGNTGSSTDPHLDFKVYTSESGIVEIGGVVDKGVEPLCFFAAEDFSRLDFNKKSSSCIAYGGAITPENEKLRQACAGFDVQPSNACTVDTGTDITADDPNIKLTLSRLDANTRATITQWSTEYEIDERLVLAVITQESKGDASAVSHTGCAGLGQFCWSTAYGKDYPGIDTSKPFGKIFGSNAKRCDCPGSGSCTAEVAGCVGDARLDPIKSAQAIPLHLRLDSRGTFSKYTDKWRFTIAAYNAGGGNIKKAITASGISDPLWEQVAPHLRTSGLSAAKADEVIGYVDKVTAYWEALGGDARPALSGMTCALPGGSLALGNPSIKVREVGSYTFRPSFSIAAPDALAPLASVSVQAKELYNRCDGRDGADPNACLVRGAREAFGEKLVSCVPEDETILHSFHEFVADCRSSSQSACGCAWEIPELPAGINNARLDLYGTDARLVVTHSVVVDTQTSGHAEPTVRTEMREVTVGPVPTGVHLASLAALPTTQPRDIVASIALERAPEGTRASLIRWRTSGPRAGEDGADDTLEIESTEPLARVLLRPDGAWVMDDKAIACAPHKREHTLCVDLGTTTLDENGVAQPLVARFALWLKDVAVSTAPVDVRAAQPTVGGYLGVTFTISESEDISHYRIWCALQGTEIDETQPYTLVNATAGKAVVRFCNGQAVSVGAYEVIVVPYDIAGQRGDEALTTTVSETDQGWTGFFSGLADGFSEEDFLNALVNYYTGGMTVTP